MRYDYLVILNLCSVGLSFVLQFPPSRSSNFTVLAWICTVAYFKIWSPGLPNCAYVLMLFCTLFVQIDGGENKRKGGQFKVGKKKVKTKLSALAKAKAAQAMEVDK
jgi:hypothetical protein